MKKSFSWSAAAVLCGGVLILSGCASPLPPPPGPGVINPDDDPIEYGISSRDIRNVATQMCPSVLAVPEIASGSVNRIKVADFKNTSRFFIDRNLFMSKLRLELNKYSGGKVRFLSNNEKVGQARAAVLKDRQSAQIQQCLKSVAAELAASPAARKNQPLKVAVIPVLNTNLVNMNADSFTAMLRSEVANASGGQIQFLMPGVVEGADYYLTGQFIPETMKTEGIINLANYIEVVDARVKAGKSMYVVSDPVKQVVPGQVTAVNTSSNVTTTTITPASEQIAIYETHLKKILSDPAMRANPNVNKRLNVMLVDAKSKLAVFEKMIMIDRKLSDNSGAANYIISGEISGLTQKNSSDSTDYVLVTVQLTDPESNEIIWEDGYEVKYWKRTHRAYR